MLRDYQQRAIDQLYAWFEAGNAGNPCLVLPTGSGKSHIVAALCKDALQQWPETRVLMLTHVKELIEQNAEKMRLHWPGAPMGIYSASMGMRQLGEPITFAGIQSVYSRAREIGFVDLVVIDECHLVNHKEQGGYRTLIDDLCTINPALRIVGLTATPYRLGHGLITDKPALFDALLEPVGIDELVYKGFLSTLRSKATKAALSTAGVHKRGGDYIESELQEAIDTDENNRSVVAEIIHQADDRRAWLLFCVGVRHAERIAEMLRGNGISAECVTGKTPKTERARMLDDFRAGRLRALTNANVLTTGFDYPDIDLIAMLRPTLSPGLYVQMAGRGMRIKSHTDHCLVLDFAGVVRRHGPITAVQPPGKGGDGTGPAPTKQCEQCGELCHASVAACPTCKHPFPQKEQPELALRDDDIMGLRPVEMPVTDWRWKVHTSRSSGKTMLAVTYYGHLSDPPVTEYLPVMHEGYAGERAMQRLDSIASMAGAAFRAGDDLESVAGRLNGSTPPAAIDYKRDGKFYRVLSHRWNVQKTLAKEVCAQ